MRGILSPTPAQGPIRLLVGAYGLLVVQSLLVIRADVLPPSLHSLVLMIGVIAVLALLSAIVGEPRQPGSGRTWHAR